VLAGSAGFLTALQDALARRLGTPPRAADSPHLAFALCQDDAHLLVFEYGGQEWLSACEDLRQVAGEGLGIVAALPPRHAAARGALLGAGVDAVVAWDGQVGPVLAAVAQVLAPAGAAAQARPVPAVPVPGRAPRPVPRAAAAPAPRDPAPAPRAGPVPASRAAASSAAAEAVVPLEDLLQPEEPNFSIVEAPPPDVAARWGDAELIAFERSSTWPGTVLSAADAEGVLAGALSGFLPEVEVLRAQVERVLPALSAPERDALRGASVPVDPSALCRAAGLRFQVTLALASAPAAAGPVDAAAVRGILAGIDAVLAELKRLEAGAPPAARGAIGGIRRALVKEAIDFTHTVHRVSRPQAPAASPPRARAAPVARILSNRAVGSAEAAAARAPRPSGKWIALAVVLLLGGAYHGWRYATRPKPLALPGLPGAPPGMIAAPEGPGGMRLLVSESGAPPDPEKLAQFRLQEEMKGRVVREAGPGVILVLPPGAAQPEAGPQPPGGNR